MKFRNLEMLGLYIFLPSPAPFCVVSDWCLRLALLFFFVSVQSFSFVMVRAPLRQGATRFDKPLAEVQLMTCHFQFLSFSIVFFCYG